jgi:hypothetical protein
VDEEASLFVIENQEFMAMRAAANSWPTPSTKEEQLKELADKGLILEKSLAEWRVPDEHRVPYLNPREIVLFLSFICASLCLPASPFFHHFLRYFDISLNHLTPNRVLHLSVFVYFCETFLGILPSIMLFRYLFRLKLHPRSNNTSVLGECGIQFCQNKQKEYFDYTLVDSVKDWRTEWFYVENMDSPLIVYSDAGPVINDRWEKMPLTTEEVQKIKPFLDRIKTLKQQGLTGFGIVASYLRRQVQPLKARETYGFEYAGAEDLSRMVLTRELTEDEVLECLCKILKGVSVILHRVDEYSATSPPPAISVLLFRFIAFLSSLHSILM